MQAPKFNANVKIESFAASASGREIASHRNDIEGIQYLRGIAALMVVAHHARHYFPAGSEWSNLGSRGVDIFFVVSGFVMAHSTRRFLALPGRWNNAVGFFARRLIRVLPLYWLVLLWTNKRTILSGSADSNLLKDFLFVPHFHAVYRDSIFPSLVPGWTINYEMFFYGLVALSLTLGRYRLASVLVALLALVILGSEPRQSAPASFYTSSVLLEFAFGLLAYSLYVHCRDRPISKWALVTATAVALCCLGVENTDEARGYADGPFAAVIVWSTVLWTRGFDWRWLRRLGDASYSIYLVHLAAFALPIYLLHRLGIESPSPLNTTVAMVVQVLVAVAAGAVVHHFVEKPLLDFAQSRLASAARRPPAA